MITAVQVSGASNWEQVQCSDTEEAFYEQGQQGPHLPFQIDPFHEWKGWFFVLIDSISPDSWSFD